MKALVDQHVWLEVIVRDENIVMNLIESLLVSYVYLITALDMMLINDLTMDYVTTCLMHECRNASSRSPKERIPPWCCDILKVTTHFHSNVQIVFIL